MEDKDYEMLVWGLQGEAQDNPDWFRSKVLLISLFGYFVLLAMLFILVFGAILLFTFARDSHGTIPKVMLVSWVLIVVPILLLTFRLFFARIPAPEGREIFENDAPPLFSMVEKLRQHLQSAPIHHVLITEDFNAAIAQCPRYGLFGGYRNYLILGLPLLQAMSSKEILAVVAHEYGHLVGNHSKLNGWIYRQRATFSVLYEHAQQRRETSLLSSVFAGLLDRFAPYYNGHTFVLSRQNEYEADAVSREIAGAEASASALIRISLLDTWLSDSFWPKVFDQAKLHDIPPVMPFYAMRKLLMVTMDEWATSKRLSDVWKEESNVHDTHPCLSERVIAMDRSATLPGIPESCAADTLLGKTSPVIAREFDETWWRKEKDKWQQYFRRYTRSKVRITELEQRQVADLSISEAQELSLLLAEFRSIADAKHVLEDLLRRAGERYPKPVYFYGRALLDEGNERGLEYLEEPFHLSPAMADECARAGYQWLCEKQSETAADHWLQRLSTAQV